jgi:cytochrome c556
MRNQLRAIVPTSALAITLALAGVVAGVRPVDGQTTETRRLMRDKLAHAQRLLEAITTSNYGLLERESAELSNITRSPWWAVLKTREFRTFSGDFRAVADAMSEAARQRDMDGAAEKYSSLVASCYACHRYVKGQRLAR